MKQDLVAVTIQMEDGRRLTIVAIRMGCLLIHRQYLAPLGSPPRVAKGWCVTHPATGLVAAGPFTTKKRAAQTARLLSERLPAKAWGFGSPKEAKDWPDTWLHERDAILAAIPREEFR